MKKIKLHGFNNLTKTLSFNIYDICYAETVADRMSYIKYTDEYYNSLRLTKILKSVAEKIDASILNIAKQDYHPEGASVTMLIAEGQENNSDYSIAAHLDKSHLTVHTYPESHPQNGVCTFRVDIDVSTCGEITPLSALSLLIDSFDPDIITLDYRVRGFTRLHSGIKIFIDDAIESIQDFIPDKIKDKYYMEDINLYRERIFHTSMILSSFDLDNYLFNLSANELDKEEEKKISTLIKTEIQEIFNGRNAR